ncbi:MAG: DUF1549 domain-containing protein [Planctomycetes bacterium]|nr:DUF1549 domain-containing protein [Planctomycetota bacterium]
MQKLRFRLTVCIWLVAAPTATGQDGNIEFFEKHVRPLLAEHCYSCHSDVKKKAKGGLRLDSRDALRKGGDQGPAVVPGRPDASLLIKAIRYRDDELRMPPAGKLAQREIDTLVEWVRRGAPDPRVGAEPKKSAIDSPKGQRFWSFVAPRLPKVPAVRDASWPRAAIDRFILTRLEAAGLTPARDADRWTLLRRLTFDLTGLPPSPAEIAAFTADPSADAYEKVVDRLLASPAFGERWARHWLDLSCHADLADVDGNVVIREAWRYRDYVIAAFNQDKPYDRFITEQLAGDLLPHGSIAERRDQLVATGFLAIGPWSLQNYIKPQQLADVVDHQIDKVGRVFLGLSLACARCHDHKFDPVPTTDYYALAGIFHSTLTTRHDGPGVWSRIMRSPLSESPEQAAARARATQEHDNAIAAAKKEKNRLETELATLRKTKSTDDKPRAIENSLREVKDRLLRLDYNRPEQPHALAVRDIEKPADSRVYLRGNFRTLGLSVPRGFPQLATLGDPPAITATQSGRRELARWLVEPDNPLTARVMVNRIWHHLFGVGLVSSVDHVGTKGEPPSHPELLDYLAWRFQGEPGASATGERAWSIKAMIREIVLSRTYQMASAHNATAMQVDPSNRLLWRMNRRRHEAEAIRDSILAVSGRLERGGGGPSLGLDLPGNVNGIGGNVNPPTYAGKTIPKNVRERRTIYQPLFRLRPAGELEILSTFDFPHPNEITGARAVTTVPTQALFLMNSPFLKEQASHAAHRLLAEVDSDDARLAQLYLLALGRPASANERRQGVDFLRAVENEFRAAKSGSSSAHVQAWTQLCHAMLASNEFLFKE